MNPYISLGKSADPKATAEAPAQFPAQSHRSVSAAPFSAVLERATPHPPARQEGSAKAAAARRDRSAAPGESEVRSERRDSGRTKKTRECDDAQHVAGLVAANTPPVKIEVPEELVAVAAPVESSVEAASAGASASVTAGVNAAANLVAVENSGPFATQEKLVGAAPATAALSVATAGTAAGTENPLAAEAAGVAVAAVKAEAGVGVAAAEPTPVLLRVESLSETGLGDVLPPLDAGGVLETTTPAMAVRMEAMVRRELDAALVVAPGPEDISQARSAKQLAATMIVNPALSESVEAGATIPEEASAVAAGAVALVAPVTAEEARRAARVERRTWQETVENSRGMGVAKHSQTMKNTMKQEDFAGLAPQILPGGVLSGKILPGEVRAAGLGEIVPTEALNAAAKMSPAPTRADQFGAGDLLEVRSASPLARMGEVISREVRMFKHGGDDLVEVVLTPDAKTQISLRLQWREGTVEVQARCDHGDHQSLNAQWGQLQSALAQHGVRLSHLSERAPTGFTEFFNNPSFSQQQGGERRATPRDVTEPLVPQPSSPAKSGPAKSGARGNRLFDSWA